MDCPFCRVSSMAKVVSGDREVDRCLSCGALWFDYGEIRELTEGRLAVDAEGPQGGAPSSAKGAAAVDKPGAILSRMWRDGAAMKCPRCAGRISAANFQLTGIPIYMCLDCGGLLAPRATAAAISDRFRELRANAGKLAALGAGLAGAERARMEAEYGPVTPRAGPRQGGGLPLPVVLPLSDTAPAPDGVPVMTWSLIAASAVFYIVAKAAAAPVTLPGGLAALPAGTGFVDVPRLALFAYIFLPPGLVPLVVASFFLFVLGDNVEDRMGWGWYLGLYLFCGAVAGAAHVIWGTAGAPSALGPAGAVAGVLGAYLVFFPDVSIRMYGMGKIAAIPVYIFVCAWVVAVFLAGMGPSLFDFFERLIDPTPLSLPGNLAGFATGVLVAVSWRIIEGQAAISHAPPSQDL